MIKYKKLIGMKVLDDGNKETIGEVYDAILSKRLDSLTSIAIKNGKLIKEKNILPLNKIISFKKDIIMANSNSIIKFEDLEDEEYILAEKIKFIDKVVYTENGECLGMVKDLLFDFNDGKLIGYIITEGLLEDISRGRSFIPNIGNIKINDDSLIFGENIKDIISKNKDYYKKLLELVQWKLGTINIELKKGEDKNEEWFR